MRRSNYDKFPVTNITGEIWVGIEDIISQLQREIVKKDFILVVDCYVGVSLDKLYECLINLHPDLCINTECLMKPENEVRDMTYPYVTDDELFGYRTRLNISDFFDHEKVSAFRKRISSEKGIKIILGCGASWICPDADLLVYGDIARWEWMSETNHQPGNTSEGIFVIGRCVILLKKVYMRKSAIGWI